MVHIIRIVHYTLISTEVKGQANLFTPILYMLTAIAVLWLVNYDRLNGIFSSGLLFVFWLSVSLASIPDIIDYSVIFHQQVRERYSDY